MYRWYVYMYVCVCACIRVHRCRCTHATTYMESRRQSLVSVFTFYCVWQRVSLLLTLCMTGWLARELPESHVCTSQILDMNYCSQLYVDLGGLNSGPHACVGSLYPLNHPPSPRINGILIPLRWDCVFYIYVSHTHRKQKPISHKQRGIWC